MADSEQTPADAEDTDRQALLREIERLREREAQSSRLLDAAPDAMVVVGPDGLIQLVNSQAEDLFDYAREELVGQPVEVLVPETMRAGHEDHRRDFGNTPSVRPMGATLQLFGRRKSGRMVPVEISLSPIDSPAGPIVVAAIRDSTERTMQQTALRNARDGLEQRVKERTAELERANNALQCEMADRQRAERALHQAQKMEAVGQLTGGVAHDFNNLLTVVMGNLNILAQHLKGDEFSSELIRAAMKAVQRGANLNRTLLAFSRRQRLSPVALSLRDLVEGMADMLRRTLGETVRIDIHHEHDLSPALADPAQLEAALLNLAVNARDAMPEGGVLTIETAAAILDEHYAALEVDVTPGHYLMLAVSDNGTGMPPEVVARAFEPFFTTKETGKGSGLGLAMVYGFVKQSGGHVKIYSEPGVGTTIKLFLPEVAGRPRLEEAKSAAERQQERGTEKILVVEDEPDVRALACRVLASLGYQVMDAPDGRQGLALLEQHPDVRLLFTDVVLPGGLNGPALAERALRFRPELKVLYTSGYTGNAIQQLDAIESEVRLITKPYTIDELAEQVRAALDGTPLPERH
ncbi:MAG: PAS domain S-box protein [Rhodocyclaceae bacterium]|nr:PAS domain S-box protein [Rhodocyclaceae bacterium]